MLPLLRRSRIRPRYPFQVQHRRAIPSNSISLPCRRKLFTHRQRCTPDLEFNNLAATSRTDTFFQRNLPTLYRKRLDQGVPWRYQRALAFSSLTENDDDEVKDIHKNNITENDDDNHYDALKEEEGSKKSNELRIAKDGLLYSFCSDVPKLVEEILNIVEEEEEEEELKERQDDNEEEEEEAIAGFARGRTKESLRSRFTKSWESRRRDHITSTPKFFEESLSPAEDRELSSMWEKQGWDGPTPDPAGLHAADDCSGDEVTVTVPEEAAKYDDSDINMETDGTVLIDSKASAAEDVVQLEIERALLLLTKMYAGEWKLFDKDCPELLSADALDFEQLDLADLDSAVTKSDGLLVEDHDQNAAEDALEEGADLTHIERIQDLLEEAQHRKIELSAQEYNLLLSRIATATELSVEDVMDNLLRVYQQMKKLAIPDSTTYEILILALDRRVGTGSGSTNGTIRDLLKDMIRFKVQLPSGWLLKEGMRCCQQGYDVELAKRLIMDYALATDDREYTVSCRVIRSLMKMFAKENMQNEAIRLLEKCIQENGRLDPRGTDRVFDAAIRWPDKNRAGKRRDISQILENILDVMESGAYDPGYSVWRNLVIALSRTTQTDKARWQLLQRPFHALFSRYTSFYPDEYLLRIGIRYCESTVDSKLARELVIRRIEGLRPQPDTPRFELSGEAVFVESLSHESPAFSNDAYWDSLESFNSSENSEDPFVDALFGGDGLFSDTPTLHEPVGTHQWEDGRGNEQNIVAATDAPGSSATEESQTQPSAPFSFKVYEKAIKICLAAEDTQGCHDLLNSLEQLEHVFPKDMQTDLWTFALKGLATISSDTDSLQRIFDHMRERGMKLKEDCYGAIIRSLCVTKREEEALELLKDMEADAFGDGIKPGLSCYNAIMLSYISDKKWQDVISIFGKMASEGLKPNAVSSQGLLIASYRAGGRDQVQQIAQELLDHDIVITQENCQLIMKILLPDVVKGAKNNISAIQEQLRDLGTENDALKSTSFSLLKSIRQAEIEQKRQPSRRLSLESIVKRREEAWESALKDILDLAETQRKLKTRNSTKGLSSC